MKKILVLTDFSDCAERAAQTAIALAKISGEKIHFLHYIAVPVDWLYLEHNQDKLYQDINSEIKNSNFELQQLVKRAEKQGVVADYFINYNSDPRQIIDYIREENFSLIVMGSHGASGMKELFIGTNAQRIVRMSHIPVLIVKNDVIKTPLRRLYFVSDFEPELMEPFNELVNFAERVGAKIHLIFVNTPSYFADTWEVKEKVEPFIAAGGHLIDRFEIINTYVFEDGLERYCLDYGDGIIAMATHGRKGISRLFYGSITEKIVNHIDLPVLSLHIPAENTQQLYVEKNTLQFTN